MPGDDRTLAQVAESFGINEGYKRLLYVNMKKADALRAYNGEGIKASDFPGGKIPGHTGGRQYEFDRGDVSWKEIQKPGHVLVAVMSDKFTKKSGRWWECTQDIPAKAIATVVDYSGGKEKELTKYRFGAG